MSAKQRIVAIEEHFWIPELRDRYSGPRGISAHTPARQLDDLGEIRLAEMDAAGIDMQVISHMQPGTQIFDAETAITLARKANDVLYAATRAHPTRFAGFAELPTVDPKAAADELERTVAQCNFKGALINGLTAGAFLDGKKFWCIFERAQALDVPIYLHPSVPLPAVMDAYYKDYAKDFPMVVRAAWGYTVETATQAIRLVLGGVFDAYPRLKIILGHLGETLPFLVWRVDHALARPGAKTLSFREAFCGHFYITTSGNFSNPALLCCVMEMGIDRILFAVDWPFVANKPAVQWMETVPLRDEDKAKILSGNAKRLFGM